jgi:hypothetical protein
MALIVLNPALRTLEPSRQLPQPVIVGLQVPRGSPDDRMSHHLFGFLNRRTLIGWCYPVFGSKLFTDCSLSPE